MISGEALRDLPAAQTPNNRKTWGHAGPAPRREEAHIAVACQASVDAAANLTSLPAEEIEENSKMSIEAILVIVLIVFLLGGGGWYWGRGRA
jgi:hypothetical protein